MNLTGLRKQHKINLNSVEGVGGGFVKVIGVKLLI